jgi:hypothetical protein
MMVFDCEYDLMMMFFMFDDDVWFWWWCLTMMLFMFDDDVDYDKMLCDLWYADMWIMIRCYTFTNDDVWWFLVIIFKNGLFVIMFMVDI